jgi:putative oxidoreductase
MIQFHKIIQHPSVILISRWVLGLTFIYAGLCKLYMPAEFAKAISNYQLVPDAIAWYMSLILPWIELLAGFLLIIGLFTRGAIIVVIALLIIFTGAISIGLLRGLEIDCGCASNCFTGIVLNEPISITILMRELFYLCICYPILLYEDKWISLDYWIKNRKFH